MRIALVTDAWSPQTNGVVRTLSITVDELGARHTSSRSSTRRLSAPCPARPTRRSGSRCCRIAGCARRLDRFAPDAVHIATEGPLGLAARRWCRRRGTAVHDLLPHAVSRVRPGARADSDGADLRAPATISRCGGADAGRDAVDAARNSKRAGSATWHCGAAASTASSFVRAPSRHLDMPRPIWLYFGRVAVEKGIEDFLRARRAGQQAGRGRRSARARAPPPLSRRGIRRLSARRGAGALVADADVFVFPSRTDTFGLVLLEAMACGVPVAAYPVTGPIDVVVNGVTGVLDRDLRSCGARAR